MTSTTLADLYLRLSDLRPCDSCRAAKTECEHSSLESKEQLLRDKASQLGWAIHRVVIENDSKPPGPNGKRRPASAFKRELVRKPDGKPRLGPDGEKLYRVLRPGFRSILSDFNRGQANAILAEDLDRACRDPRDLEDLIDVAEAHGIHARSLSGSLTLTAGGTDAEITMARVMVTMGNKSSRDTRRRVAQSRERRAQAGKNGGGRRPYGFAFDGNGGLVVDEHEAGVIREAAEAVLAAPVSHAERANPGGLDSGMSLKALARDLRKRGDPTVTGAAWTPDTLGAILVKPALAGISLHRCDCPPGRRGRDGCPHVAEVPEDARPAWMTNPILEPDVWQTVVDRLTDPARKTTTGNAPRWLGSGIYRCGKCDDGTTCIVSASSGRAACPRYVCRASGHLGRAAGFLDDFVVAHVVERLARPDAVSLLRPARPGIDAGALRKELRTHESRLTQISKDYDDDVITRAQMLTQTASRRKKIDAVKQQLAAAGDPADPLGGLAGNPDAAKVWEGLTLEQQRAALRRIAVVTILPAGRGLGFNPDHVVIEPVTPGA